MSNSMNIEEVVAFMQENGVNPPYLLVANESQVSELQKHLQFLIPQEQPPESTFQQARVSQAGAEVEYVGQVLQVDIFKVKK